MESKLEDMSRKMLDTKEDREMLPHRFLENMDLVSRSDEKRDKYICYIG